jgi:Hint module
MMMMVALYMMKMMMSRWMIIVVPFLLLARMGADGFPTGAGSCDGNGPAFSVTTSHRDSSAGKEIAVVDADQFQFLIDGKALVPGVTFEVNTLDQWYWQVKALDNRSFKGFLVRLETSMGFTEFDLDCTTESPDSMQDADTQCASTYIRGCTHRASDLKNLVTGTFVFSRPIALVKFDVTVVYMNNSARSRYAHQSYQMKVVADTSPTPSPTNVPNGPTGPSPPSSPSPPPVSCFSGQNTVHEQQKGTIPISDLRVGDRVRTKGDKYTTVYSLGHWDPVQEANFIQLRLSDGTLLELSDDHMVYCNGAYAAAKTVRVGDRVDGAFGETKQVTDISRTSHRGLYAPLTEAGHLLVNGILSSSYVDVMELGYGHDLAHWMLAPVRVYCTLLSNNRCADETHAHGISNLIRPLVDVSLSIKTMYMPAQYTLVAVGATLMAPFNAF